MSKFKIAVLNDYKMKLPHYGKYNGMYGMFTVDGFVYIDNIETQLMRVEEVEYDEALEFSNEEERDFVFEKLELDEY